MKQKPTLYRQATYHIKVPGVLDASWEDWADGMMVAIEGESKTTPVTTLIATVDQAALQGLLRRLYALGLPLISITYIDEA